MAIVKWPPQPSCFDPETAVTSLFDFDNELRWTAEAFEAKRRVLHAHFCRIALSVASRLFPDTPSAYMFCLDNGTNAIESNVHTISISRSSSLSRVVDTNQIGMQCSMMGMGMFSIPPLVRKQRKRCCVENVSRFPVVVVPRHNVYVLPFDGQMIELEGQVDAIFFEVLAGQIRGVNEATGDGEEIAEDININCVFRTHGRYGSHDVTKFKTKRCRVYDTLQAMIRNGRSVVIKQLGTLSDPWVRFYVGNGPRVYTLLMLRFGVYSCARNNSLCAWATCASPLFVFRDICLALRPPVI